MSKVITFRGYGVGAGEVFIVADRITHFRPINYNGITGVEIQLDTGKAVNIDGYLYDVKKQIEEAMNAQATA